MSERYCTLVHPSYDDDFIDCHNIWQEWELDPRCVVIHDGDGLLNCDYALNYPDGSVLLVGGEYAHVCVRKHLETLARHVKETNALLSVKLSIPATWSWDLHGRDPSVCSPLAVITAVNNIYNVDFELTQQV